MKHLLAIALLVPSAAWADVSVVEHSSEPLTDNQISFEVASMANKGFDGATHFGGMGIRYSRTLKAGLLFGDDALSAEAGVFFYTVVNYAIVGDDYTVIPVSTVLQYGRTLEENFRPYLYAGVMKNFSFAERNPTSITYDGLSNFQPAIGIGFAVNFKGMIARADIGTDMIGAGLAYGF